jgi:hypothetical protein
MHETELRMYGVEVEAETLAAGVGDTRTVSADGNFESIAEFEGREDADQSTLNAVTLSDGSSFVFFADFSAPQVFVGSAGLFGYFDGMLFDEFGLLNNKRFEGLNQHSSESHKLFQAFRPTDRSQMSSENDAIEARQGTCNFVIMFLDKLVHGVFLRMVV